ncbi:hypothetical protein AX16_004521 [Volvariella volvacea WC 439]|nr:hypothetical protein AX16_004521 [Volvariella volvacea WC 439]
MVATRKAQAAPAPPSSRTNSSQTLPKASANAKSKPLQPPIQEPQPHVSAGKKHQKQSAKQKDRPAPPRPRRIPFYHRIITFLLIVLTFHTITTCPTDASLSSPVCRSLAIYRHNVVEPYILPPVTAILKSPSVKPYVESVQSTLAPHVQTVERVEKFLRPYTQRAGSYLNWASVKVYYSFILPTYRTYVLPHVETHALPHYNAYVQPYIRQVTPYINYATASVQYVWVTVKPHVVNTYVFLKPHVIRAWIFARPYLCATWHQAKVQGGKGAVKFVELRKEFVDPHIRRIWEKVVEPSAQSPEVTTPVAASTAKTASISSFIRQATVVEHAPQDSSTSFVSNRAQKVRSTPTPPVVETQQPPPANEDRQKVLADESAASIVEESAGAQQSGPEESLVEQIRGSGSSIIPGAAAQQTVAEVEEDLDDFLRDIGVAEQEEDASAEQQQQQPQHPMETETPEEKKARVAAQRAEIVGRHTAWQAKIDDAVEQGLRKFRAVVGMIRWDAVDELERREGRILVGQEDAAGKKLREELGLDDDKEKLKGWINGERALYGEAERFVRAMDNYIKKSARKIAYAIEAAGGDENADTIVQLKKEDAERWVEIVQKVEEKFHEKMQKAQAEVHHWYMSQREKEVQEILKLENEVKAIASDAQSDIGMDYAWLDDVTHWDWKKYHHLMTSALNFAHELRGIQNGTHADPAPDPLIKALDALQVDLNEIVTGFQQRVRMIREEGDKLFATNPTPPVGGNTQTQSGETQNSDKVSISPTDPQDRSQEGQDEGLKEAARIVVGRGREEVEQAFQRAAVGRDEHEL